MKKSNDFVLYLYDDMGGFKRKWGNARVIYRASTIEEVDNFTMVFEGPINMISFLNDMYDCDYKLGNVILVNPRNNKSEFVRYCNDSYDIDNVKNMYRDFLLKNRNLISGSLLRVIKNGINIDKYISDEDFDRVFKAYYRKNDYKKIRDTYFELVKYGVIVRKGSDKEVEKRDYDFSNEEIGELYARGDYEEIYSRFDLDDIGSKDLDRLNRGRR